MYSTEFRYPNKLIAWDVSFTKKLIIIILNTLTTISIVEQEATRWYLISLDTICWISEFWKKLKKKLA